MSMSDRAEELNPIKGAESGSDRCDGNESDDKYRNDKCVGSERTLEDELFEIGMAAFVLTAALAALYQCVLWRFLPRIPCFFDAVLKIYCPGCGGTRSLIALLHGHFLKALWYHPFIPYFAVVCGGFLLTQGLERLRVGKIRGWRFHCWYLWAGLAVIVLNWTGKNILRLGFGILM